MSLALFRSALRSAVRDAQDEPQDFAARPPADAPPAPDGRAEVLRQVARGDLSVDQALRVLGDRP